MSSQKMRGYTEAQQVPAILYADFAEAVTACELKGTPGTLGDKANISIG